MAKAALWSVTDAEARKRGEQTGLDTLVVRNVQITPVSFAVQGFVLYLCQKCAKLVIIFI